MIDTCPEIHGDRSELYFHLHHILAGGKVDRYFEDQMQTSVTIIFRISDVILFLKKYDIILLYEAVPKLIYIINERTYDTDPGNILLASVEE